MLDVLLIWNCILIENLLFPFNMVTMYRCEILQKIRVYMWELLESEIFWKCWEWYTIMWTLGCGNVQVLGCYICFIKREGKKGKWKWLLGLEEVQLIDFGAQLLFVVIFSCGLGAPWFLGLGPFSYMRESMGALISDTWWVGICLYSKVSIFFTLECYTKP